VNPPIRTAADNEALWKGVLSGHINQIVSDHACCMLEMKQGGTWNALPGFGGTALIYPILVSEGFHKRKLPLHRIAELVSAGPARNFALYPKKGSIAVGMDADMTVLDPNIEAPVTGKRLLSAQDHTPFEGFMVKGWPTETIRGGQLVYQNGKVLGGMDGKFIKRPVAGVA
jgi:dihydropyrimidinase/allantoinase